MITERQLNNWERVVQSAISRSWINGLNPQIATDSREVPLATVDQGGHVSFVPELDATVLATAQEAIPVLVAEVRRLQALLDPPPEQIERIAAAVHDAWRDEMQRHGFADHPYFTVCCAKPREWHHPDMVIYDALPETQKAYDRATVQAVLAALRTMVEKTGGV